MLPSGAWFETPSEPGAKNVLFTSQWENYPREASVPLRGRARGVALLLAGSTNPMQSRFENGEVVVSYADGSTTRLALENPTNWLPIEEDYFFDDFQFRIDATTRLPTRVNLKTGEVRALEAGTGQAVPRRRGRRPVGGALAVEPRHERGAARPRRGRQRQVGERRVVHAEERGGPVEDPGRVEHRDQREEPAGGVGEGGDQSRRVGGRDLRDGAGDAHRRSRPPGGAFCLCTIA